MGRIMFNNDVFDQWLHQKTEEILSKVGKEKITTEEMLILSLKAQTNHFNHIDVEFRGEFKSIKEEFKLVKEEFRSVKEEFKSVRTEIKTLNEQIDKRFERHLSTMKWGFGILISAISGIFLKILTL